MKQIKHLILTPFSFNCPNATNDEWMEKRWQIFMDVTYPSIMNQTVMDFKWIVGFSDLTSQEWRDEAYAVGGFETVYAPYHNKIWTELSKRFCDQKYLLTTRVDSDDALAETAVEQIQSAFTDNPQPRIVNFKNGLITDGKILYHMKQRSNNFISMLELADGAVSVRGGLHHPNAKGTPHFQDITDNPPLWMIYVHDGIGHNITWTMKWAKEHQSCLILHEPVSKKVFDTFNTNLKYEEMQYESPN